MLRKVHADIRNKNIEWRAILHACIIMYMCQDRTLLSVPRQLRADIKIYVNATTVRLISIIIANI